MSTMTWSDGRTGICGAPEPGPGPWPLADVVHRFRAQLHLPDAAVTVAGAALTADAARAACVGEAVERYAALVPRAPDLVASEAELAATGRPYVAPARLGAPASHTQESVPWLVARDGRLVPLDAARGSLVAGGAALVSYPQGSTGLAAGAGFDRAVRAGAAEVVERDAVARAWSAGQLAPVVPAGVLPARLHRASLDAGLEVVVHLLPTGCPGSVVTLVGLRDPATGFLGVGAAYRPDVAVAATKAWVEAVVSIAQAAELADPVLGPLLCADAGLSPWRADRTYADAGWSGVTDLAEHAQLLVDRDLADRVWARLARTPAPPPPRRLGRPPCDLLAQLYDVVAVELTPTDVRAAGGPTVVRVLAVGARTVRPAGLSPEELPCPLV